MNEIYVGRAKRDTEYSHMYANAMASMFNYNTPNPQVRLCMSDIKEVIFNEPATIVIWKDGTKTVVKCKEGEEFIKESGLALCVMKKCFGLEFHKALKKFCTEDK